MRKNLANTSCILLQCDLNGLCDYFNGLCRLFQWFISTISMVYVDYFNGFLSTIPMMFMSTISMVHVDYFNGLCLLCGNKQYTRVVLADKKSKYNYLDNIIDY